MSQYLLLTGIATFVIGAIAVNSLKLTSLAAKTVLILAVLLDLSLASYSALQFSPGDYNVYTLFFSGCKNSLLTCYITNSYEPGFYGLSVFFSYFLQLGPHYTWLSICLLHIVLLAFAIWIFCSKNNISYSKRVSAVLLCFGYLFTNLTLLAIRFGLSASIFLLALAILYKSRKNTTHLCAFVLLALATSIHFQVLFMLPLPLLYYRTINPAIFPSLPLLVRPPSFSITPIVRQTTVILYFLGSTFIIFTLNQFDTVLVLLGKGYYVSGYKASTLGLRPLLEAGVIFLLIYPTFSRLLPRSSELCDMFYICIYFLGFSLILSLVSMQFFSIDGFSRQVQLCFILFIILRYNLDSQTLSLYNLSYIALPLYVALISVYTVFLDVSFGQPILY